MGGHNMGDMQDIFQMFMGGGMGGMGGSRGSRGRGAGQNPFQGMNFGSQGQGGNFTFRFGWHNEGTYIKVN